MPKPAKRPEKKMVLTDNLELIISIYHDNLKKAGLDIKGENGVVLLAIPQATLRKRSLVKQVTLEVIKC